MNNHDIYQLLDLTCLKDEVTTADMIKLVDEGKQKQVAALCVWPQHLKDISPDCLLQKATVVNFPSGIQALSLVLSDIDAVLQVFPHTEIDYVFPYTSYLNGEKHQAIAHCQTVVDHCHQQGSRIKVIMETGAFPNETSIFNAASDILNTGCDFLKTSTGKIAIGATPQAVAAICDAINDSKSHCGIKVSGGIKTLKQARDYLLLIQSKLNVPLSPKSIRFGCSQLDDSDNESTY
ncbi:MAG: deoxyribose-phosphate aldolase [Gammaproteobacteria bacterium]|nr:deoxyribose-phosphate aldolase [Gammaproteobacteria bacterium]